MQGRVGASHPDRDGGVRAGGGRPRQRGDHRGRRRRRASAKGVDVLTFEFENVSAAAAAAAEEHAIVRPNGRALAIAQHRIREKTFLADHGIPVAPFAPVRSEADLVSALQTVGTPAVLKIAAFGYDGKGQVPIARPSEAAAAWEALGRREAILEAFLDL